ncbi:DUF6441 family protein [Methylobacterium sp. J-092]|uniref:DUF6441 family protein n=1 Tax=Methylobacterium sp. J-092 TaxID=2836667 RepID=UPI001FB950DB|nr:DUF6441 family protein [Methylobacterium sp. J-092]MCJ2009803.1 DUF6441 family protein [Methylobacterium sp. J-092]
MTRFSAQVPDIRAALKGDEVRIATSITAGMQQVTDGLKADLRSEVTGAGLGQRLANTWRGQTFPTAGVSADAAAYVSTKAAKLIDAFDRGATIRAQNKKYLAIPTDEAGVKHISISKGSGRITPAVWERETGIKLRFVPSKTGGVLVAPARYRRQAIRFQKRKSFKPIKEGAADKGRDFVVIFVLVPQVKLRKRLDVDATAKRWAARVPAAIEANWKA